MVSVDVKHHVYLLTIYMCVCAMVFITGHEVFTYQKLDTSIEIVCVHKKIQTTNPHTMIVIVGRTARPNRLTSGDDDDVGLYVLGCRVDIFGANCKKLKSKDEWGGGGGGSLKLK